MRQIEGCEEVKVALHVKETTATGRVMEFMQRYGFEVNGANEGGEGEVTCPNENLRLHCLIDQDLNVLRI